jgi:Tfp pilus assembly pilus retraction ATPase PilT
MEFFNFLGEESARDGNDPSTGDAGIKRGRESWADRLRGPKNDFNETITLPDTKTRLRVNGFQWHSRQLYGAAIRCQPAEVPALEMLGVPEVMKSWLDLKGLVLVTGPTCSGKSTTIAASVSI